MKRFTMSIALVAFVAALAAPLAFAQGSPAPSSTPAAAPSSEPAKAEPAKTEHHSSKSSSKSSAPKIDINSCTKEELMTLPGVGDVTADKIIAGRPYKSKKDIESKKIVTSKEYSKISGHIIAKQETAPAAK
ncbi:MAG TPA: helix-hairpin-helix domain-containing protein [Candidatus Eisenbacteria bacterium]